MACQLSREQTPADGAPQGAEPAHSTAEIPYTTQRDAIRLGQLYHCLKSRLLFDELAAFPPPGEALGAAAA